MQPGVCTNISKDHIRVSDHETGNLLLGEALVLKRKASRSPLFFSQVLVSEALFSPAMQADLCL